VYPAEIKTAAAKGGMTSIFILKNTDPSGGLYGFFGGRSTTYRSTSYDTTIHKLSFDDDGKITYDKVGAYKDLYKLSKENGSKQELIQMSIDATNTKGVISWVD